MFKMKKIIISLTSIFTSFLLALSVSGCGKKLTAEQIYESCLYNVVEMKAVSDGVGESFGTAELVTTDGRFVTNAHVVTYSRLGVVNKFESYSVRFSYEEGYRAATLEKFDAEKDIAVLKLNDTAGLDLKPVKFGNSEELKAGESIYAVGNASNYGVGIFAGIISIPLINIELDGSVRSVIQCDLTIAAGNSGGALLNGSGEFVGMTTFRTKDNSGNVIYGIVYCIPADTVRAFLE